MSKRMNQVAEATHSTGVCAFSDAVALLKKQPPVKFDESVDIALHVGVDPRKHTVRGVSQLPHGQGRAVKVAVFAQGDDAKAALDAGADMAGSEDLIEKLKKGPIDVNVVIATPDMMKMIAPLAKVLGPKGLMPNPKMGTVTPHVAEAVAGAKKGQAGFRLDKAGIIHTSIGRLSFSEEQLSENLKQLLADIKRMKPAQAKGQYLKKLSVSTTMGAGIHVDLKSVEQEG
jgi:large subunit ribosomal protein L1